MDGKNCRLVDSATKCYCTAKVLENQIQNISINKSNVPSVVKPLFEKYLDLLAPRIFGSNANKNSKVKHCIDTGSTTPTFAKVRQLNKEKRPRQNLRLYSKPVLYANQNPLGPLLCTSSPKVPQEHGMLAVTTEF